MRERIISSSFGLLGILMGLFLTGFGLNPTILALLVATRFLATVHLQTTYDFSAVRRLSLDVLALCILIQAPSLIPRVFALFLLMGMPPFNLDWSKCRFNLFMRPLFWTYLLPALPLITWLAFIPFSALIFEDNKMAKAPRLVFLSLCLGLLSFPATYFVVLIWLLIDRDGIPNGFQEIFVKASRALLWLPHGLFRAGEVILVEGPIYGILFLLSGKKAGSE